MATAWFDVELEGASVITHLRVVLYRIDVDFLLTSAFTATAKNSSFMTFSATLFGFPDRFSCFYVEIRESEKTGGAKCLYS
jgi:hypothetical protein